MFPPQLSLVLGLRGSLNESRRGWCLEGTTRPLRGWGRTGTTQCRGHPSWAFVPRIHFSLPGLHSSPALEFLPSWNTTQTSKWGPLTSEGSQRIWTDLDIFPCSYIWLVLTLFLNSCSVFQDLIHQGSANFQGADSKYFKLSEPYGLCPNYIVQHIDSMQTGCMTVFQ